MDPSYSEKQHRGGTSRNMMSGYQTLQDMKASRSMKMRWYRYRFVPAKDETYV